jgi:hypothetical protein
LDFYGHLLILISKFSNFRFCAFVLAFQFLNYCSHLFNFLLQSWTFTLKKIKMSQLSQSHSVS